jgi:hypothetical protein
MATANAFFGDTGNVVIRNQPGELDPERIAKVLDGADDLQNWLNAVRALATRLAEQGVEIANPATGSRYHLAEKHGHRKFKDTEIHAELVGLGLGEEDIFEKKMRSPAGIEKKLGAERLKPIKERFDALIHKPVTGRALVSSTKSSRPPVKSAAEAFFA